MAEKSSFFPWARFVVAGGRCCATTAPAAPAAPPRCIGHECFPGLLAQKRSHPRGRGPTPTGGQHSDISIGVGTSCSARQAPRSWSATTVGIVVRIGETLPITRGRAWRGVSAARSPACRAVLRHAPSSVQPSQYRDGLLRVFQGWPPPGQRVLLSVAWQSSRAPRKHRPFLSLSGWVPGFWCGGFRSG
jgi:hypothetical protein